MQLEPMPRRKLLNWEYSAWSRWDQPQHLCWVIEVAMSVPLAKALRCLFSIVITRRRHF